MSYKFYNQISDFLIYISNIDRTVAVIAKNMVTVVKYGNTKIT